MRHPECIITGCGLQDDARGTQYWGDLHQLGDVWIFNAVTDPKGQPIPQPYRDPKGPVCPSFLIVREAPWENYFQRRGVFVIPKSEADLNDTATNYIKGAPRG